LNQRISHERLARICFVDYDREMALIVERTAPQHTWPEIIAVGRLTRRPYSSEAEFALLIGDEFQGQGLATELLKRLIGFARDEKIERVAG
jgi:acetyltransferase